MSIGDWFNWSVILIWGLLFKRFVLYDSYIIENSCRKWLNM